MDFLQKVAGRIGEYHDAGHNTVATEAGTQNTTTDEAGKSQGTSGGIMNSLNNIMGGGAKGEKNEDAVDKVVDWAQEHILKEGPQNNESAIEQQKDEMISDTVRSTFKKVTGHDIPVEDK